MRTVGPLVLLLLAGILALPGAAHAAIPFFEPIIPPAQQLCAGNWYLVMVVINNIISFSITLAIVFVAPVMIAYSGFLLVANAFNPGAKADAKKVLTKHYPGYCYRSRGVDDRRCPHGCLVSPHGP
ncbi:MAG: hypothetical protein WC030_00955 [Candidatus Paceibacterota bacterium]